MATLSKDALKAALAKGKATGGSVKGAAVSPNQRGYLAWCGQTDTVIDAKVSVGLDEENTAAAL
jgi:hypothetical protein